MIPRMTRVYTGYRDAPAKFTVGSETVGRTMTKSFGSEACRPVPWLESFTVGDAAIDAEHRAMIDGCNDFCRLAARGADADEVAAVLRTLASDFAEHAASEEALFPLIRFPGGDRHAAEHRRLRERMAELVAHAPVAQDLPAQAAGLRALLVEHVLRYDLAFKTWIEESRR